VKIATWNVNSINVRLEHVLAWLERERPDVLALQETKTRDADFPADALRARGYTSIASGQAGYNGVALVSRLAPTDVVHGIGGYVDEQKRVLGATFGDVRIFSLYVPNGERPDSEKYAYKLGWFAALRSALAAELERYPRVLLAGDFNVAPEDRDVYDPVAWQGHVLCTPAERAALASIIELGLSDTFRLFEQPPDTYSWWDYRAGFFRRNRGLRIDLMLASAELSQICKSCRIDRNPRGWERPSDHAPVVAEFASPDVYVT
jgi:exodeoxyribonuclease-3